MLGIENIQGLESVGGLNLLEVAKNLLISASSWVLLALLGLGVYFVWFNTRAGSNKYNITIEVFQSVNGKMTRAGTDKAREFTIPKTGVKAFHLKGANIYLPRPTRDMGKNVYWYAIRKSREWMNVDLKDIDETIASFNLDFDHSDNAYANEKLKQILDASFNKGKWWQTFRNEIGLAVLIIGLTFSFWFLTGKMAEVVTAIAPSIDKISIAVEKIGGIVSTLDNICTTSGVRVG